MSARFRFSAANGWGPAESVLCICEHLSSDLPQGDTVAAFVKFNEAGGVVWQNLNADGNENLLLHAQLLLDSQNNAYLAAGTLFQMAVCKVNHDGGDGWLYLVGGGSNTSAITMGPNGRVYLTGGNTAQLSQPYPALVAKLELGRRGEDFVIAVTGEIGQTYSVEMSDDFVNWKPLFRARLVTGRHEHVDPDSSGKPRRFYRMELVD